MMGRLRSGIRGARDRLQARRATWAAARRARALPPDATADMVVDFLMAEPAGGIEAWQIDDEEFRALAHLVERKRPRTVLEIGTADGGTLLAHSRLAHEEALIISLDLPQGPFGGGYPPWRIPLYARFAGPHQDLHLLRMDSHAPGTAERLAELLGPRRLDYAFIDGDHTSEGVRQDFELCLQFAAPDAVIAFHDIAERPNPEWVAAAATSADDGAVHAFWQQVRRSYGHEEIIHDPTQEGYGIGVLYLDQKMV